MSEVGPRISILIPVYNAEAYLTELLVSIQAQTFEDFEILVWDDGSADESMTRVREFQDRRLKIVREGRNVGLNAAWCGLLSVARGEYWICPGADDRWHPELLSQLYSFFAHCPDAVLAHSGFSLIDSSGRSLPMTEPRLPLEKTYSSEEFLRILIQHNIIKQPSALVRMSNTKNILTHFHLDFKYCPDWYLWILIASMHGSFHYDPTPLLYYRVHADSLTLRTDLAGRRCIEVRLAPLLALRAASSYSQVARAYRRDYEASLKALALRSLAKPILRGDSSLDLYRDLLGSRYSLLRELVQSIPRIFLESLREWHSVRGQVFRVSGLASIDDPLFRRSN